VRNGEAAKEGGKEEVTSKEEGAGTKEAATKASKELEGRLAKLGTNISKADAMAVAEKADGLAAACSLHVDSVPPTGRFHFRSLLTRLDTQTKELRSLNVSRAADTSKLVKELQSTVKELGTAIQR
jgi:abelson tyrosine-protein kinase 1